MDDDDAPFLLIVLILAIHADQNRGFISKWSTHAVSIFLRITKQPVQNLNIKTNGKISLTIIYFDFSTT